MNGGLWSYTPKNPLFSGYNFFSSNLNFVFCFLFGVAKDLSILMIFSKKINFWFRKFSFFFSCFLFH